MSPALYHKSQSAERAGKAAALGALSYRSIRTDQAVSLATAAKFAGFAAENRVSLTLIKTCFVTNNALAFFAIVSAADSGGNHPSIFVYIVHYIEPSGREALCVHKRTRKTILPGRPEINPIYWGGWKPVAQYKELGAKTSSQERLACGCGPCVTPSFSGVGTDGTYATYRTHTTNSV